MPKKREATVIVKTKVNARVRAGKLNGRLGGLARAARHSKEQLSEWGKKAGGSTFKRYGSEYYRHIRKKRKTYPSRLRRRRPQQSERG